MGEVSIQEPLLLEKKVFTESERLLELKQINKKFCETNQIPEHIKEVADQSLELADEFWHGPLNPGYKGYHTAEHFWGFSIAGYELFNSVIDRVSSQDSDPFEVNNLLKDKYSFDGESSITPKQAAELIYLVGMVHDLGNLGIPGWENNQLQLKAHTQNGKNVHRSGLLTIDSSQSPIPVEELTFNLADKIAKIVLPSDNYQQIGIATRFVTDCLAATIYRPKDEEVDQIKLQYNLDSRLFTLIQSIDQIGQAYRNPRPNSQQILGLIKEIAASSNIDNSKTKAVDMISFVYDRKKQLLSQNKIDIIDQVWGKELPEIDGMLVEINANNLLTLRQSLNHFNK